MVVLDVKGRLDAVLLDGGGHHDLAGFGLAHGDRRGQGHHLILIFILMLVVVICSIVLIDG